MFRPAGLLLLLACPWLVWPAIVCSQAKTALSWVRQPGADGCIAAPELGRRVEEMVGPVLAAAPQGEISIEGRIARRRGGYEATVVVTDAAGAMLGQRRLRGQGQDCRQLDDQLVFVIAVAIDPDAALSELPGEFAAEGDPGEQLLQELRADPPQPVVLRGGKRPSIGAAEAAPPQADAGDAPVVVSLALGPGVGIGWLDSTSVGASLQVAVGIGSWSVRMCGLGWLSQRREIDMERGVSLGMWLADIAACPILWAPEGWQLSSCLGLTVARLSAASQGFSGASPDRWLSGPSLGAGMARELGMGWSLLLGVQAQTLWPRHKVVFERGGEPTEVYRVASVMASSELLLQWRF